jgi:hypothetical protein
VLNLRNPSSEPSSNNAHLDLKQFIFFKGERIYAHRLVRFNYTTYDIRRAQDVVNPGTSHRDVMLLNPARFDNTASNNNHAFLYARVIGIYHANVIYTGPGSLNYEAKRFDFLWVRWYEHVPPGAQYRLDQLSFPPMSSEGAFGFIDPDDVLRSSHIIPAFSKGSRRNDIGTSKCARDSNESNMYYVGR